MLTCSLFVCFKELISEIILTMIRPVFLKFVLGLLMERSNLCGKIYQVCFVGVGEMSLYWLGLLGHSRMLQSFLFVARSGSRKIIWAHYIS